MANNPRKPAFALVMSLVLPGWGQLYNGEMNKAIWLFLAFAVLSAPALALIALYVPNGWMMPSLLLGLAATLAIWLYGMVDAWRSARRRQDYVAAPWQVSGAYALVFIVCNVLVLPLLIGYVRAHQVESFRIPSGSMLPGIEPGDFIFADKRYNCPGCKQGVRRGDIAIFVYPNDRTLNYIKRIIGLPGDRIQIKGSELRVNDKLLTLQQSPGADGTLVTEGDGDRHWHALWATNAAVQADVTVPAGHVFVLGDNRSTSTDSRQFGTVPLQDVVGLARQIWFSYAGAGAVRWGRLGRVLQ
jgi:signal peptidase I